MRALPLAAGAAALTLAALAVATPASAATLASGQRISVAGSTFSIEGTTVAVYGADPATAALTKVGEGQLMPSEVLGLDVNDDGIGYAVARMTVGQSTHPGLYQVDANTGVIASPVQITHSGGDTLTTCDGIDLLPSGKVLVACINAEDGLIAGYIGSVDPVTGVFTALVTSPEPALRWSAIAFDEVTGQLFGFTRAGGASVYPVDLDNGTVGTGVPIEGEDVLGADFDRDGRLFVSGEGVLGTMDPALGVFDPVGPYSSPDEALAEALTIWGRAPVPPALPATGGSELWPSGLGTALLFLVGAAFIATHGIRRRAA